MALAPYNWEFPTSDNDGTPIVRVNNGLQPDDQKTEEEERKQQESYLLSTYIATAYFLQSIDDPGVFGFMEDLTRKLNDVGDAVESHTDNWADKIENSHVPFSRHLASGIRHLGRMFNGGAHSTARNALAVEHALANIDDSYLEAVAYHESHGNPFAHAPTSSARGLYQFLDQAWLGTIYKHGAEHGGNLAAAAQRIERIGGRYVITDSSWQDKIMIQMREDVQTSTVIARDFTNDNADAVSSLLRRDSQRDHVNYARALNNTDLYMAHFLGPAGDTKFLEAMATDPNADAARLFSKEAAANHNVFYDRGLGRDRTVAEVYRYMGQDFQNASAHAPAHPTQFASSGTRVGLRA